MGIDRQVENITVGGGGEEDEDLTTFYSPAGDKSDPLFSHPSLAQRACGGVSPSKTTLT